MNPDNFEAGFDPVVVDDDSRHLRMNMVMTVERLPADHEEENCEICRDAILAGEVACRLSDFCGITCVWHRRCLEEALQHGPIDEKLLEARFAEIAEGWGRDRSA